MNIVKPSALLAVATVAGASTVLVGAPAPAHASAADGCGVGTLIAPGVCELEYTGGTSTFTATADMTHLEALLVGAGGDGYSTTSYAAGGGGGEVKVVDLTGTTGDLTVTVPTPGVAGGISGASTHTVGNGSDGSGSGGGASGNGNLGHDGAGDFAGGGGASGAANGGDGGAGVVVGTLVGPGSLFADDTRCFGGGGAGGDVSEPPFGVPGCGAGAPDATGTSITPAAANSGGGGGALVASPAMTPGAGADGYIALRWNAVYTITFDVLGRGAAPAAQLVAAGSTVAEPATVKAEGYQVDGWFLDPQLTIPVDFSLRPSASATYYARWVPALADSGADVPPVLVGATFGAIVLGGALVAFAARRRRHAD